MGARRVVTALVAGSIAISCVTPRAPSAPVSPAPESSSATGASSPNVQMTPARRERLPNGDRDGDAVVNAMDECPDLAEDPDHLLDEDGCPEEDADDDGTLDAADDCPREPGSQRVEPKKNGCPYVGRIMPAEIRILERVRFAYGDATMITDDAKALLDMLARVLKENPQLQRIDIRGHASSDEPAPDDLGAKRAQMVLDELVARGIEAARLTTSSRGKREPRSDNQSIDGRIDNRRVEFEITKQSIDE